MGAPSAPERETRSIATVPARARRKNAGRGAPRTYLCMYARVAREMKYLFHYDTGTSIVIRWNFFATRPSAGVIAMRLASPSLDQRERERRVCPIDYRADIAKWFLQRVRYNVSIFLCARVSRVSLIYTKLIA